MVTSTLTSAPTTAPVSTAPTSTPPPPPLRPSFSHLCPLRDSTSPLSGIPASCGVTATTSGDGSTILIIGSNFSDATNVTIGNGVTTEAPEIILQMQRCAKVLR